MNSAEPPGGSNYSSSVNASTRETLGSSSNGRSQSSSLNESDSSIFERWQHAFAGMTGVGQTAEQKADRMAEHQRGICEKWKNELVKYSQSLSLNLSVCVTI